MQTERLAGKRSTTHRLSLLLAVSLLAVARTMAQEQPAAGRSKDPAVSEPERRIVISIPDRKLALIENGEVVKVYPIAVGAKGTPSPTGEFKIINRLTDPAYYAPGKVIEPGGENPLGTRWMGLSKRSFGIHGTNEPKSIGKRASHGCIRMRKEDVEELFELIRVGDVVELHGKRNEQIAALFPPPQSPAATPVPAQPVLVPVVAATIAPR